MKSYTYLLLLSTLVFFAFKHNTVQDADSVLSKTVAKLNSLKRIDYNYYRSINYISENYRSETFGATFLEANKSDTVLGLKFQVDNQKSKIIYNGTEFFSLDKTNKTVTIFRYPNRDKFEGFSFFLNSIITLKNSLPQIISNKNIPKHLSDTTINNKSYYIASFVLESETLSNWGNLSPITLKRDFLYKIAIDKKNFLPFMVIQKNSDAPQDYVLTSFTNIKLDTTPTQYSWFYSTYTNDYELAQQKQVPHLLPVGSVSPNWALKRYMSNDSVSLYDFKGKVVLLDFWIKNCGPCIESVPDLKAIIEKYKSKDFKAVSINAYDSEKDVEWFCNKYKVDYNVLINGSNIAEKNGVYGFPSTIVIDKDGRVVYSAAGFDKSKIESVVEKYL